MISHLRPRSDDLGAWCRRWLGAEPARVIFETGHLSYVAGVELADGRQVVLKGRPPDARIEACLGVQRHLWASGYPCPQPLAGPAPLRELTATAETYVPGGEILQPGSDSPALFAGALAELIRLAPPVDALPPLEPAPPWVGWGHGRPGLWPLPDDRDTDLDDHPGPPWLDDLARRARERLARSALPPVVGHADWESQNIRWSGRRLRAVHDWDSVAALPEAAFAGAASVAFTATAGPLTQATAGESDAFLAAYETARGRPWSDDERQVAWAAGLWLKAFDAKKATLDPGGGVPVLGRLAAEAGERLRRAGA